MARKDDPPPKPPPGPFNSPFAGLASLKGALPSKPLPEGPKPVAKGPTRAVVRYERKGRGGKEVTLVEHLELKPAELEQWAKALKAALGCGGGVEDEAIILQGDQRDRLPAVLEKKGVRKVTVS